ncbi:MAG: sialidase family protein [Acidobacteriota bacterium]
MRRTTSGMMLLMLAFAPGARAARGDTAVELGVKGRSNANASIAASGTFVAVTWAARSAEGVTDIYAATSRDDGRTFTEPVQVNRTAGEASVSGEQPPRVALVPRPGSGPSVVVVWTAKGSAGTRLVSARSNDGGRAFGPVRAVPGTDASGNRGWESIGIGRNKEVVALWLDHRAVPARTPAGTAMNGEHQHGAAAHTPGDSVARAQLSQLFFATLDDPASAHAIASGVCYCCKTSVATGSDGSIFAAWRQVYPGNIRDIAVTRSKDGGAHFAPPVRVSEDNWAIDGCPENGPALAVDGMNTVHVVWPTLVQDPAATEPTLALFYATSKDGLHFTRRQRLSTEGVARHAQMALGANGEIVVAWDEQLPGGGRHVVVARGTANGAAPVHFIRESIGDGTGTYPVVAASDGGTIVAWASGPSGQTVLRLERLPSRR